MPLHDHDPPSPDSLRALTDRLHRRSTLARRKPPRRPTVRPLADMIRALGSDVPLTFDPLENADLDALIRRRHRAGSTTQLLAALTAGRSTQSAARIAGMRDARYCTTAHRCRGRRPSPSDPSESERRCPGEAGRS